MYLFLFSGDYGTGVELQSLPASQTQAFNTPVSQSTEDPTLHHQGASDDKKTCENNSLTQLDPTSVTTKASV